MVFKDHALLGLGPVSYTHLDVYKRQTTGFRYEVLIDDSAIRKAADDILLDFFSEDDPYTLSEYTQKMGGI